MHTSDFRHTTVHHTGEHLEPLTKVGLEHTTGYPDKPHKTPEVCGKADLLSIKKEGRIQLHTKVCEINPERQSELPATHYRLPVVYLWCEPSTHYLESKHT